MARFIAVCAGVSLAVGGAALFAWGQVPAGRPVRQVAAQQDTQGGGVQGPGAAGQPVRPEQTLRPDQPIRPDQPVTPQDTGAQNPTTPSATASQAPAGLFGSAGTSGAGAGNQSGISGASNTPSTGVNGAEAVTRASTDAGDLLGKSPSVTGVETQKRTPVANEARVRGYNLGQTLTFADGQWFFPARQDLDTFLSKVDSGSIRDMAVIKGPYSAIYGPAFAFIDIQTQPTPRYENGFELHGRTVGTYKGNGQQSYGRQEFWGGSSDWGYQLSYGIRNGNDYETGHNAFTMPSGYFSQDTNFAFGYDFSPDSHMEVGYIRLDQRLEFPGQIFDTDRLSMDAVRLRYVLENQDFFDRFTSEAWYNHTVLKGDAQHENKRNQIPQLNDIITSPPSLVPLPPGGIPGLGFVGFTDIDEATTGYRVMVTWGKPGDVQLTVGTDLRYITDRLNETDSLLGFNVPCFSQLTFGIPRSHETVLGGLFAEAIVPIDEDLTVKAGARGDYEHSDIDHPTFAAVCPGINGESILGSNDFSRDAGLFLGYMTSEYKASHEWTLITGAGTAQRPPTLTELYANQPFLAVLQNGFTTVIGNDTLSPERLFQVDVGARGDYGDFRAGVSAFYSWVNDYITYEVAGQSFKQGAITVPFELTRGLTVRFVNTPLATLGGGEAYAEADLNDWLTPFSTVSYVDARDRTRDHRGNVVVDAAGHPVPHLGALGSPGEPLPGIAPLEGRLGLRVHEVGRNPRYGIEFSGRLVAAQNRVAESLGEVPTPGFGVWDLRGFWRASEGVLVTAGVENIFDRLYREHLDLLTGQPFGPGVYQPGINPYFGLELRY